MTRPAEPGVAEAETVVRILGGVLGRDVLAAYLYGSAVVGGLRPHSDIDVLAVVARSLADGERREIVDRLLDVSGSRATSGPARPFEVTIVAAPSVRPWRFPPRRELQYGEWLRDELAAGPVPGVTTDPDLAPLLTMVRAHGRVLVGPEPAELIDPVPPEDLRRAIVEGLPGLQADLDSDTTNVLLTLARIWLTLVTGDIGSKDAAADWALARLPEADRPALARARAIYVGQAEDGWIGAGSAVRSLADRLLRAIDEARQTALDPNPEGAADAGNGSGSAGSGRADRPV